MYVEMNPFIPTSCCLGAAPSVLSPRTKRPNQDPVISQSSHFSFPKEKNLAIDYYGNKMDEILSRGEACRPLPGQSSQFVDGPWVGCFVLYTILHPLILLIIVHKSFIKKKISTKGFKISTITRINM